MKTVDITGFFKKFCITTRTTVNQLRNERLAKGQYTDAADDMLLPNFCVRLHFQPQQHDSHAVKQPVVVDFSVTIRIFKAIYLSGEAGNHARFVMKKDVNHIVYTKILMIIFSLTVSAVSRLIPVFGMVV